MRDVHAPVVLVTGASSGIGRAIVRACSRDLPGARFVLTARREDQLRETAELANLRADRVEIVPLDITAADAADELLTRARERFGRLDVLVNNAGAGTNLSFEDDVDGADARRLLELNLVAPMLLSRASLDMLEASGGCIVNIASVAGLIGRPGTPLYSATKWGITGFSESLYGRVARRGIHVATVHPGPVPTPGWAHGALTSRRAARPLFCTADAIGDAVVLAVRRRRAVLVRPRLYRIVPLLRILTPRLTRAVLRRRAPSTDGLAP